MRCAADAAVLAGTRRRAALGRVLGRRQARAQRQLRLRPELLAGARAALLRLQTRARRWPLGRHGWARLAAGFMRIYRPDAAPGEPPGAGPMC